MRKNLLISGTAYIFTVILMTFSASVLILEIIWKAERPSTSLSNLRQQQVLVQRQAAMSLIIAQIKWNTAKPKLQSRLTGRGVTLLLERNFLVGAMAKEASSSFRRRHPLFHS